MDFAQSACCRPVRLSFASIDSIAVGPLHNLSLAWASGHLFQLVKLHFPTITPFHALPSHTFTARPLDRWNES